MPKRQLLHWEIKPDENERKSPAEIDNLELVDSITFLSEIKRCLEQPLKLAQNMISKFITFALKEVIDHPIIKKIR